MPTIRRRLPKWLRICVGIMAVLAAGPAVMHDIGHTWDGIPILQWEQRITHALRTGIGEYVVSVWVLRFLWFH